MFEKGIYNEFNTVPTFDPRPGGRDDFLHIYIVYRDGKGGARVIRGGPSGFDGENPTRSTAETLKFGPLGKIEVQADIPLDKSKDAYKPGETPQDRNATKLDIGTRDPKQVFDQLVQKAQEFHDLNVDYDIKGTSKAHQNSNSLNRVLMESAGIDPKTAIPANFDRARIPGFENNMKDALEEARRERERELEEDNRERNRPNPIEGEIGGTDDQNPTPSPSGKGPSGNGPSGQDDGADDDNPSGGSSSGGSSGEGQPQSLNLTDPEAPSHTMELKPGQEATSETKELTPEQNDLLKDIGKSDGPLDEIIAKDPRDWTEGEFVEIKKEVINLPAGPEQERLDDMATNFLEHKFGDGLAKYDAVGRMIDPEPIRPINQKPVPAKTPDGEPLTGAVNKIGRVVAGAAGAEGRASAVQGLQSGLNLLKQVMERGAKSSRAGMPGHDLKTDGVVGPKTRRALRSATANFGRPKIEEGFALGRFTHFAQGVQTGRDDTRKLKSTISKAFGPLFRPLGTSLPKAGRGENLAFQATLNDLGPKVFEPDAFKPIREDGLIGPRTETAFNAILPAAGPDRFTSRLGHNLGFFDFDDFG